MRARVPFLLVPNLDQALLLKALRADRCVEYAIVGWQAIASWFEKMRFYKNVVSLKGVRQVTTKPSEPTLKTWRKNFAMPVVQTPRSNGAKALPWTTNLLLQSWIATQGRALSLPRWHKYRIKVTGEHATKPQALGLPQEKDTTAKGVIRFPRCSCAKCGKRKVQP